MNIGFYLTMQLTSLPQLLAFVLFCDP